MAADQSDGVLVEARVENLFDLYSVRQGLLKPQGVRRVTLAATIDPEVMRLSLPDGAIRELGLQKLADETVRERGEQREVYTPVLLTVQGRDCHVEVVRSTDGEPAIIGRTPLLLMDWVIDVTGRLIGNPAHGGEQMFELY